MNSASLPCVARALSRLPNDSEEVKGCKLAITGGINAAATLHAAKWRCPRLACLLLTSHLDCWACGIMALPVLCWCGQFACLLLLCRSDEGRFTQRCRIGRRQGRLQYTPLGGRWWQEQQSQSRPWLMGSVQKSMLCPKVEGAQGGCRRREQQRRADHWSHR